LSPARERDGVGSAARRRGAADPMVPGSADPVNPTTAAGTDALAPIVARAGYMMGENVARGWSSDQAAAWEGFLELAGRLRRGAEKELDDYGELSVSMLGAMGRLITADRRTLRETAIADAMGLSLSRVSRIIDILEKRRLVKRTPCPVDGRATNVTLTPAGLRATRAAQDALFAFVEGAFFDKLSEAEIATLATVFGRLLGREPSACRARPA
jgi:DNA-binding MarR family transcriptional regulator